MVLALVKPRGLGGVMVGLDLKQVQHKYMLIESSMKMTWRFLKLKFMHNNNNCLSS